MQNIKTIVFDLDGTIYQDTVFHRQYLQFLVEGTDKAPWLDALVDYAEAVFRGKHLDMNSFYRSDHIEASTINAFFRQLEAARLPDFPYEQALLESGCLYTGDAWALMTLLGKTLGLLNGERGDIIYKRTRERMDADGMRGNTRLREAILALAGHFDTVLVTNSYESTALAFLEQLGFSQVFEKIAFSADKPTGMLDAMRALDMHILSNPSSVLSIGDHAFNDLMPLQKLGCRTLWVNPFEHIRMPQCDESVHTLDELAAYLEEMVQAKRKACSNGMP